MHFTRYLSAFVVSISLVHAATLPRDEQQQWERGVDTDSVHDKIKAVLSSLGKLDGLAEGLVSDLRCLLATKPLRPRREHKHDPDDAYSCCGKSCKGSFCHSRLQCHVQPASSAFPPVYTTDSHAPTDSVSMAPSKSGTSPTCAPTLTTAPAGSPSDTTVQTAPPVSNPSNSPSLVTTTDSSGQTVISGSGGAIALPSGISSSTIVTLPGGVVVTFQPSTALPTTAPSPLTTTDSNGQTVISDGTGTTTLPTGISTPTVVTLPGGSVVTFQPSGSSNSPSATPPVVITTGTGGATIISDASGATTLPTGLSTSSVVTLPGGSVVTIQPSSAPPGPSTTPGVVTTTDNAGQTVISDASGAITLPTGISTASVLTLPGGSIITIQPSSLSSNQPDTTGIITTTNSVGQTVISDTSGAVTLPTGISTVSVVTLPGGSSVTIQPSSLPSNQPDTTEIITTTNTLGQTIISDTSGVITLPAGISTASVITLPGGSTVTFSPTSPISSPTTTTSTSSTIAGGILPVVNPVPSPQGTVNGSIIPCNLWFFNLCISWIDINIQGWAFNLPTGIRPPGPPPPITFPPSLSITVSISGTLPPWPAITIDSNRVPSFESEPSPCETESAELCFTSTSFDVNSATVTTSSQVLSTCATVFGCNVQDSATSTTTTATCSATGAGCACATWTYDDGTESSQGDEDPDGDKSDLVQPAARRYRRSPRETGTIPASKVAKATPAPTMPALRHPALQKRIARDRRNADMANIDHPDFAAMDAKVNEKKAAFFVTAGQIQNVAAGQYQAAFDALQDNALVAKFVGFPEIVTLFRNTHERLYQDFVRWDQDLNGCGGLSSTWAATYSEWMTSHLSSRNAVWTNSASAWYQTLTAGLQANPPFPQFTHLASSYPVSSFTVPVGALAGGLSAPPAPPAAPPGVIKRQGACTLTAPTATSPTVIPSGTPITINPSDLPTLTSSVVAPTAIPSGTPITINPSDLPTLTSSVIAPTATASAVVDIFDARDCENVRETINLVGLNNCYSGNIPCFRVTSANDVAIAGAELSAFATQGCPSGGVPSVDFTIYPNISDITGSPRQPFDSISSLSLLAAGTAQP
ncbi:hypothetical protein B9Z65_8402 [Elsinoe australis]|uniref:Uncharacterized protein n=1 Tax=Elsinoe australis TaxID=40998 RepID=A0A2P7YDN4_9PEZI|nr:hypothetical protein B9Z65_8402 [Elsinoe australis]